VSDAVAVSDKLLFIMSELLQNMIAIFQKNRIILLINWRSREQ